MSAVAPAGPGVDASPPPVARTDAAASIGAEADRRWEELDTDCRIPDDIHQLTLDAGLFRTLTPTEFGGGGTPIGWFRNGVELARHDASLAWVVTQGAAELGWIAAGADPTWAAEVLSDPNATSASTIAGAGTLRPDGDEATLSGRWGFNTGAHDATWIGGLTLVEGVTEPDGSPQIRFAWVPADQAVRSDDWNPSGMRGTGSITTTIPEQRIPLAWTFSPFDPTTNERGPYRCLVGNGNWPIAGSVAAVQLGIARRALDEAAQIVTEKAPPPEFTPLAENHAVQLTIARADGLWNACRSSVEEELDAMWHEATQHGHLTADRRLRLFLAHATAAEQSVRIVTEMCELVGTTAMRRGHPLNRCRNDAQALHGHLAVNHAAIEIAGKIRVGLLVENRRV